MLNGIVRWIFNRKALCGLCVLVMGLGLILILLASAGGVIHFLSPNQSNESGDGVLFRVIGGLVLVLVGFAGLVLGSANSNENVIDWMDERELGETSMKICCCFCRSLNDVETLCCRDCGADLSPTGCREDASDGLLGSRFPEPLEFATSGDSLRSTQDTRYQNASGHTDLHTGKTTRSPIHVPQPLNVQGRGDKIETISSETEKTDINNPR